MSEQQVVDYFHQLGRATKVALLERGMTQKELAKLLGVNAQQLNRAIKGGMAPKDVEIRKKVHQVLNIKEEG
ncbi:helix-turn-helix domain-containing protein [Lactobacillus terrae]|uniref:helix-turn-helix domain-containing protein n=1 Tax=Lactobacillus terrae TaxID=2269374 RepID=UPI000C1B6485|nr:helix-turn-helix transcriptional regulator [Lactobacillus terrae]